MITITHPAISATVVCLAPGVPWLLVRHVEMVNELEPIRHGADHVVDPVDDVAHEVGHGAVQHAGGPQLVWQRHVLVSGRPRVLLLKQSQSVKTKIESQTQMKLFTDNQQGLIVKSDCVGIASAFLHSCEVVDTPVGFLQPAQLVLGRAAVPLLLRAEVRAGAHLYR